MTPRQFLDEVVQPDVLAALKQPHSLKAVSNAILTMDALVGIAAWYLRDKNDPSVSGYPEDKVDTKYRSELANSSSAYKALSDAAASLKQGWLTRPVPNPRVMTEPRQMTVAPNTIDYMQAGIDSLGGNLVYL